MPWNSSNPLYRWKQKHGKLNKSVKSKVDVGKPKMSKRRSRFARARRRYSPRRYARRFRKGKSPMPILPLLGGVVAPLMSAVQGSNFMHDIQTNPTAAISGLIDQIGQKYTGYSFLYGYGFDINRVIPTYTGLFAGLAGHMLANKLGVNRYMKKVPIVGKWVQL